MESDRIDWIFDEEAATSLEERYDTWAATYDADHDAWGWRGPDLVAAATLRHLQAEGTVAAGPIVDAGCGTGMAGRALRNAGWIGAIVGLDLSRGMLEEAAASGAYDDLVQCSLYEVPLAAGCVVATVSSGVFTLGHVGGEALAELCRIALPRGLVTVTQRLDLVDSLAPHVERLRSAGAWAEIERTAPEPLHPERDDTEQSAVTWRVLAPGNS